MLKLCVGDVVGRISYKKDIYFKITKIIPSKNACLVKLRGLDFRLKATAPLIDLEKIEQDKLNAYWLDNTRRTLERQKEIFRRRDLERKNRLKRAVRGEEIESFERIGSLLHIDGDPEYLELCLGVYRQLRIPCQGYHIQEENQAQDLMQLLNKHNPDMLVLTGHDGLIRGANDYRDITSYHNSQNFVSAVKVARKFERNLDNLVIFAGACQSNYEALLEAGANFASSPQRVLIHAYDPVFLMEKIAYTSVCEQIVLKDVIGATITGFNGIGGLETRGKHRLGLPKSPYF